MRLIDPPLAALNPTPPELIEMLQTWSSLDKEIAKILNDMYELKNKASERTSKKEEITSSVAIEYARLSQRMIQSFASLELDSISKLVFGSK